MLSKLRSHLNFANVVAMVALFVALSGTSYAVSKVGSKDIRKNAVRGKHIKKSQVHTGTSRTARSAAQDLAPGLIGGRSKSTAGQARRDAGPTGVGASRQLTRRLRPWAAFRRAPTCCWRRPTRARMSCTEGRCRLQAGDDYDDSNRGLRPEGTPEAHSLQLVHAFPGAGAAVLACRSPEGTWSASDSKIIAIKVASASSNVVSG